MMYLYRRKQVPEGLKIERISEVCLGFASETKAFHAWCNEVPPSICSIEVGGCRDS